MKRLLIRLVAACLTFAIGVSTPGIWERRQRIIDAFAQFLMDYED